MSGFFDDALIVSQLTVCFLLQMIHFIQHKRNAPTARGQKLRTFKKYRFFFLLNFLIMWGINLKKIEGRHPRALKSNGIMYLSKNR
jgi:hypothetical protein